MWHFVELPTSNENGKLCKNEYLIRLSPTTDGVEEPKVYVHLIASQNFIENEACDKTLLGVLYFYGNHMEWHFRPKTNKKRQAKVITNMHAKKVVQ